MTPQLWPHDGISTLLGIALVVDDANKGQRLVFRYPPLPRLSPYSATGKSTSTSLALYRCAKDFLNLTPEVFARLFRPKSVLCGHPLRISIDRVRYLSYPVLTSSATKEIATDDVLLFNVILAMGRTPPTALTRDSLIEQCLPTMSRAAARQRSVACNHSGERSVKLLPTATTCERLDAVERSRGVHHLEDVLGRLSRALLHEERRCGYVSLEVGTLLDIAERMHAKGAQTMLDTMMEESALAADLKRIYHSLREGEDVDVIINDWLRLSIPGSFPRHDDQVEVGNSTSHTSGIGPFQPSQTLLLLMDEEDILTKLPERGSQKLRDLVRAASPLKTLEETSAAIHVDLPHMYTLAAHLQFWGLARAMRTITLESVYAVCLKRRLVGYRCLSYDAHPHFQILISSSHFSSIPWLLHKRNLYNVWHLSNAFPYAHFSA